MSPTMRSSSSFFRIVPHPSFSKTRASPIAIVGSNNYYSLMKHVLPNTATNNQRQFVAWTKKSNIVYPLVSMNDDGGVGGVFGYNNCHRFSTMLRTNNNDENISATNTIPNSNRHTMTNDNTDFQSTAVGITTGENKKETKNDTTKSIISGEKLNGETPRTSMLMEITDRVGVLHDVLRYFWKYDVNICRIESRPIHVSSKDGKQPKKFDFFVDMEGSIEKDDNIRKVLNALKESQFVDKLLILDAKNVHWFPTHVSEIDLIANRVLDAGQDLEADHPGFLDPVYRTRRAELAEHALKHTMDQPIQRIIYTDAEKSVWAAVWDKMETLWDQYACQEYIQALTQMRYHCGYDRTTIPQQQDISLYLQDKTGFRMRPVAGLLSSRDFLNALAFRVFCSTQYIRHSSKPLYTPEPDIVHELLGHAPMLADPDFADFSQQIGLASLGASDDEVAKLARCYWFSVEFGLCKEDGKMKAYGAGLLSSFGELEFACNPNHPCNDGGLDSPPEFKPWDPEMASKQEFPITSYQPVYFVADSLMDAKIKMRRYCEDLPRPFFALHNEQTDTVHIDRPVQRTKGEVPPGRVITASFK